MSLETAFYAATAWLVLSLPLSLLIGRRLRRVSRETKESVEGWS